MRAFSRAAVAWVTAAAVSHGTISVAIAATNEVSQPNALAAGTTTPVQNADVRVTEPNKPMFLFQPGIDLRQIVDAVTAARAKSVSWQRIGELLGTSAQAAQQRYGAVVEAG